MITSFFFIITSALGVGYGDVYPRTFWGRVLLLALYLMIVIFVPKNVITLYRLKTNDRWRRDRSRLENKTKKRHLLLTGHCSYRDVASVLVYQWREDFVGDDFILAVLSPTLNMEDFKHSPY